ncbi:MAG: hypothetical protein HY063_14495 [Bacteroidetes bacterium]|nr:hypothetical protein [Bacteroidota bacterium]
MKSYLHFFIVITSILGLCILHSCSNSPKKTINKNTSIFSNYLQEQFNIQIPHKKHFYITVPQNGCQGAIANSLNCIDEFANPSSNISILVANEAAASKYLTKNWNIINDKADALDILNLPISNVSIIITENDTISLIKSSNQCEYNIINDFLGMLQDTMR